MNQARVRPSASASSSPAAAPTSSPSPQSSAQAAPRREIALVLSNVADAPGILAARELGLPTAVCVSKGRTRAEHDADMLAHLRAAQVDLVCLAGYMRLLSPEFIAAFPNRILNIHPSLLPAFPGLDAQQQAFDYGVQVAGCTVHFVDEHLDHGVIILQRAIPVLAPTTPTRSPIASSPRSTSPTLKPSPASPAATTRSRDRRYVRRIRAGSTTEMAL